MTILKSVIKGIVTMLLWILGQEETQRYLIDKADRLAKKTKTTGDDWLVEQFKILYEKWRS